MKPSFCSPAALFLAALPFAAAADDKPTPVEQSLKIDRRYLLWPVAAPGDKTPATRVFFELDGRPLTFADIRLGVKPAYWTFTDLADFQGRTLTIKTDLPGDLAPAWQQVKLSGSFPGEDTLYHEPLRPQFHFSSRRGWINDPNGLIFANGTWHLFYQHNPYNRLPGNLHWGHATSSDLVHWTEQADALYPGAEGAMFSGTAFVLPKGSSALPVKGDSAIALAYTAEGSLSYEKDQPSLQCGAISEDGGKTFTKFEGNPLLGQYAVGNRDPRVFFHEPTGQWVMVIYLQGNQYGVFTSPDLKTWVASSQYEVPGESECPDLFQIALDGDPRVRRWVAWGASGKYMLGSFNGTAFQSQGGGVRQHYFGDAYAGQTFANVPDGRRVHLGWLRDTRTGFTGESFNQQMTLPMDVTLRPTVYDMRLWMEPAKELEALRLKEGAQEWKDLTIAEGKDPLSGFKAELFEVDATFDSEGLTKPVGFRFFGKEEALWNPADQTFSGAAGAQEPVKGVIRIHSFVDRTSLETFVNGTYIGRYVRQDASKPAVELIAEAGAKLSSLKITPLKSIWK